jgi:uncharacterized protein YqiB (DUF1249 family)
MQLYEANFGRLMRLIPDLGRIRRSARAPGLPNLDLEILERSPYTTTILLSLHLPEADRPEPTTSTVIRVYHDAKLAEAFCPMKSPDER